MPRRVPLPPHLRDTAFTVADGADAGLSAGRMRGADLERPFHGVRAAGSALTSQEELCRAYARRLPPEGAYSHMTAARLWGLPLPTEWSPGEPFDVAVPAPARAPRGRNVRGHQIADRSRHLRGFRAGVPVMGPASTWLQLATLVADDDLVAAGDYLVRVPPMAEQGRPFCTLDELSGIAQGTSWGCRRARRAAALVREGSDSRRSHACGSRSCGRGCPSRSWQR